MEKLIVKQCSELLLELAIEDGVVNKVYEDYQRVHENLNDELLQKILGSPKFKKDKKKQLVIEVVGDVYKLLQHFILVCVDKGVTKYYDDIFYSFEKRVWKYQGKLEATVYSVLPLTDRELYEIKNRLEKKIKKEIILTNKIDKHLISGIKLECEAIVLDNSLEKRLEQLSQRLKGEV